MRALMRPTVWIACLLLATCRSQEEPTAGGGHGGHGGGHGAHEGEHEEEERPGIVRTTWTAKTELFVEFPALVVGLPSPFAAHLTTLEDFQPVAAGRVLVTLTGGEGGEERFEVTGPNPPGIFRPAPVPRAAGKRRLRLTLESGALRDEHDLGEVVVHPNVAAAHAAAEPEEPAGGTITFLKEQQWRLPFATSAAGERELRPSHVVYGSLRPRPDGEVRLTAPLGGRLLTPPADFPRVGAIVAEGQTLVTLAAPLAETDVASLELAIQQAGLAVQAASREVERLEELFQAGVIAERRVVDARHGRARAGTDLAAARRRLEQHNAAQGNSGEGGAGSVAVASPLAGTVVGVSVVAGVFVEPGQELVHLVDLGRLWLEARVPETDLGRVDGARGAWFEVDGYETTTDVPGAALVSTGGVVDPVSRTVPLVFEVANPDGRLRVGAFATVHLPLGEPLRTLAVPASAVLEERGLEVVYVQVEGEAFERRVVRTGVRDAGWVAIASGLEAGEYVVVEGAFAVKLAASAAALPAHGHAH